MVDVYLHVSPSGKAYVGIASHGAPARWRLHVADARRGSAHLFHRAIRKYGADAFEHHVLEQCLTWAEACEAERFWIDAMQTHRPSGYNLTLGGDGALGRRHTAEARERMAAAKRGKSLTAEHRARLSAAHVGLKMPPSAGAATAERNRERVWSDEARTAARTRAIGNAWCVGRKMSPATRARISGAKTGTPGWARGRTLPEETKAKLSAARKGVLLSEDHVAALKTSWTPARRAAHTARMREQWASGVRKAGGV